MDSVGASQFDTKEGMGICIPNGPFCVRIRLSSCLGSSLFKATQPAANELDLDFENRRTNEHYVIKMELSRINAQIKATENARLMQLHTCKLKHGVFFKNIQDHSLSVKLNFSFLRSSELKSKTDGFIMASPRCCLKHLRLS